MRIFNVPRFPSLFLLFLVTDTLNCQKPATGPERINSDDLKSHLEFLASPYLKGRSNGEPELNIATNYLATQAKLLGLRPANTTSYFQPYTIIKNSIDNRKTSLFITTENNETISLQKPIIQLLATGLSDFELEGEVVFAGYGIKADKYNYNDFENINTEGKIILAMNRSPMTEDGSGFRFEEPVWSSFMSIQVKLASLLFSKARAILFVADPKSGYSSVEDQYPSIANELKSSQYLKGSEPVTIGLPGMPKIIFIHREVADALLNGTGHTLEELQKSIDSTMKPQSFNIKGKKLKITCVSKTEEVVLNNVAAWIEGSDPVLKNEFIIFSGHADHVGGSGEGTNTGADDNASGCAAMLEIADAFQSLERKPLRSVLFLWVTGEEIGLFGSQTYVSNPIFPLESTVVNINMDMIGRVKGVADTTAETPMSGPKGVFVISGNQSSELIALAEEADKRSPLDFDYSLSGRDNPLQLFARSDHYNFVKKDIPVLFFTTGLHTDYHTPGDVIEKIDFEKLELVAKTVYDIGFTIANRKNKLVVDNPFSKW